MKILNLGLLSLLAVLAASVFLTSCEQDVLVPKQVVETNTMENEAKIYMVEVPAGLTEEAAIEWAREQSIHQFTEISSEESLAIIESRWCYTHTSTSTYLNCQCTGCAGTCKTTQKYCGGWSGGDYVVVTYDPVEVCGC